MENLIWIEVLWRYDWVSHWQDEKWNKFSKNKMIPLEDDELCRYWKIYKVKDNGDYTFTILSERDEK